MLTHICSETLSNIDVYDFHPNNRNCFALKHQLSNQSSSSDNNFGSSTSLYDKNPSSLQRNEEPDMIHLSEVNHEQTYQIIQPNHLLQQQIDFSNGSINNLQKEQSNFNGFDQLNNQQFKYQLDQMFSNEPINENKKELPNFNSNQQFNHENLIEDETLDQVNQQIQKEFFDDRCQDSNHQGDITEQEQIGGFFFNQNDFGFNYEQEKRSNSNDFSQVALSFDFKNNLSEPSILNYQQGMNSMNDIEQNNPNHGEYQPQINYQNENPSLNTSYVQQQQDNNMLNQQCSDICKSNSIDNYAQYYNLPFSSKVISQENFEQMQFMYGENWDTQKSTIQFFQTFLQNNNEYQGSYSNVKQECLEYNNQEAVNDQPTLDIDSSCMNMDNGEYNNMQTNQFPDSVMEDNFEIESNYQLNFNNLKTNLSTINEQIESEDSDKDQFDQKNNQIEEEEEKINYIQKQSEFSSYQINNPKKRSYEQPCFKQNAFTSFPQQKRKHKDQQTVFNKNLQDEDIFEQYNNKQTINNNKRRKDQDCFEVKEEPLEAPLIKNSIKKQQKQKQRLSSKKQTPKSGNTYSKRKLRQNEIKQLILSQREQQLKQQQQQQAKELTFNEKQYQLLVKSIKEHCQQSNYRQNKFIQEIDYFQNKKEFPVKKFPLVFNLLNELSEHKKQLFGDLMTLRNNLQTQKKYGFYSITLVYIFLKFIEEIPEETEMCFEFGEFLLKEEMADLQNLLEQENVEFIKMIIKIEKSSKLLQKLSAKVIPPLLEKYQAVCKHMFFLTGYFVEKYYAQNNANLRDCINIQSYQVIMLNLFSNYMNQPLFYRIPNDYSSLSNLFHNLTVLLIGSLNKLNYQQISYLIV